MVLLSLFAACTISTADTAPAAVCPDYSGFGVDGRTWLWTTTAQVEQDFGYRASQTGEIWWQSDDGSEVEVTVYNTIHDDAYEYSYVDTVETWVCDDQGARLTRRRVDSVSAPVGGDELAWYTELTVDSGGVFLPWSLVDGTVWTQTTAGQLDDDGTVGDYDETEEFLAQELDSFETLAGAFPALLIQRLASDGTQTDHQWRHTDLGRLADAYMVLEDYAEIDLGDTGDAGDSGL